MSVGDKIKHKAEEVTGTVKEKVGDATDNERLQAEGAAQRTEAQMKQAGDHVKDAAHDTRDALRNP
ncbi:CsbD family protein [Micromonospora sp. NBC_01796]|uniref:CsbD family protein n=1 Tax=Micromonospora sp. NBC_01796 TaxID=2975987 RepID=UPI002DD93D7F|nr:CsbD family protein [Micromonospora sp. NBC_01796]WSA82865.1 CsbD family protein [Micromonospora sp. NBC_01796]